MTQKEGNVYSGKFIRGYPHSSQGKGKRAEKSWMKGENHQKWPKKHFGIRKSFRMVCKKWKMSRRKQRDDRKGKIKKSYEEYTTVGIIHKLLRDWPDGNDYPVTRVEMKPGGFSGE